MAIRSLGRATRLAGPRVAMFQHNLLGWYRHHRRDFTWRAPRRTPYEILLAEMLLRKTDAAKVSKVYKVVLARYPSPVALSRSRESSLRCLLAPLGIHDRARLLRATAKKLARDWGGAVPDDYGSLREFPGIGHYTANAVLCFAFRKDVALLDANIIRVLGRVFSVWSTRSRAREDPELWAIAQSLVPERRAVAYNRALLDLAALVCRAKKPKCSVCPISGVCEHRRKGRT